MRRFVGCIIEESLTDNSVLGRLPVMAERVSHMPNDPDATVWHVRWYQVAEDLLLALLPRLAETIRPHWYAHFWAGDDLCVVMPGRVFWAKISDPASHAEFVAYGDTVGIERKWSEQIPTVLPAWATQNDHARTP
jgi:hypothetical protein